MNSPCVVEMEGQVTKLLPKSGSSVSSLESAAERKFTFDYSFWSCNAEDSHFACECVRGTKKEEDEEEERRRRRRGVRGRKRK
jgi:hypothetical protein